MQSGKLFQRSARALTNGRARRFSPAATLEMLESRVLLTVTASPFSQTISFTGQTQGSPGHPDNLIMDSAGDIYGTSLLGGVNNYGAIYEIPAGTSSVVTLASFSGGTGGFSPVGNLVLENGSLYGATSSGGAFDRGTLFQFNLTTNALTVLASFRGGINGADPTNGIASDGAGHFFGTTFGASQQNSTIFEYTVATGQLQTLVFLPIDQRIDTGVAIDPATGLVKIANEATVNGAITGTIFATTTTAGGNNRGTIFSFALGTGATTVHTITGFDGTHGNGPLGSLLYVTDADAAGDDGLVGLTSGGGTNGHGTVFDAPLTLVNGQYTTTLNTLGVLAGGAGGRPNGNLLLVDSANTATNHLLGSTLYGVTATGGGNSFGSVFKITNAAPSRAPVAVPPFTKSAFSQQTGTNPSGGLILTADGTLIGTTSRRGQFDQGSIFFLPATAPVSSGVKLAFSPLPKTSIAGTALGATAANAFGAVVVKIEDAAGHVVTTSSAAVTLQVATQAGGFTPVTVAAVNGIATFTNILLTQSGSYTLLATSGTATVQSNSFIVSAAAASKLAITSQPAAGNTTRVGPVVVAVEDAFGNIVTTDKSTVSLAAATGPGALSGVTTAKAKKGIATFDALTLATAGAYTLAATDGALTAAVSTTLSIGAPATQIVFTQQPQDGIVGHALTSGQGFTVQVTLLDANGNVATSDGSIVTLLIGSHPGGAKLTGTSTASVINGVATFSSLQLFAAGTYTLRAVDGPLNTTSTPFNVAASA